MSNVKILGKKLTKQEVTALKALVSEAGWDPKDVQVVESITEPDPANDDEVVLILATPSICSESNIEKEMAKAANGSRRAIWIWPKEATASVVPEACKKFSYSVVSWDAKKLAAVIADDDVTCFELPTGQPMPKVKMEHNLCVEDLKKLKKTN